MRLLSIGDIAKLTGIKANTLRQRRTRGKLPEPTICQGRVVLWTEDSIREWMRHERLPGPDRS